MDGDVVDLSVKKGASSAMSNQSRSSSGRGRRDISSPDISLPLPFAFNQFVGSNNVIPQVQVPHDLTRLVSMLRERDELTSTISAPSNRATSVPSAHLTSILLPQMNLSATSGSSAIASRKQSSHTNLKRKRSQNQDVDNFCLPQSQFSSPTHPVRRSLRPRAERSYAESPDIVVDYEDEPPAKMNGIASTNGNGHCNEGDETSDTDSDCGEMPPLPVIKELSPEEVEEREKLLEALREQVRNEETKLVLLKKIRQSQIMKENLCIPPSNNSLASNLSINSAHTPSLAPTQSPINNHSSSPNITGFNMSTGIKGRSSPKLPSGNNHLGSISQGNSSRHLQSSPNKVLGSSSKVPSLLKGQPAPLRGSSSNQVQNPISNLMMPPQRNSSNSSVPHNLLMAQQSLLRGSRGNMSQSAANMMLNFGSNPPGAIPSPTISPALDKYERPKDAHSGSNTSTQQLFSNSSIVEGKVNNVSLSTGPVVSGPSSTVTTPISTLAKSSIGVPLSSTVDQAERRHRLATTNEEERETPAQRQAAAKLALRKQLEKTLLQIPPPKPPPPEMNFIPNPSNMEFLALIGLEFVVDYITRDQSLQSPAPEAVTCIQCETDFSSMWKLEKGKVICDQCATSNAKKSLKAEHTNRLKTAFVQALQQEQEIEQRLAQGGSLSETLGSVTNSLGRNDSSPSPTHTPTERDRHSPQVSVPSDRVGRNRTPTQSPGLVPAQLSLPVRDRDRERDREHKDREREAQREIEKAMAAAMSSAHFRERESNRERNSRANNDSLNLSAHSQHSFTQQLKLEMAQLAQMHEQQQQQLQQHQQQQQLQLNKHSSRGSNKNNNSNMMNSRGDKREKERDAYRDRGDSSHTASNLLSMTLGHTMANQLLSQNIQNLTMGQAASSSGNHSSSQKSSSGQSSSRRPRNVDQSHKQPSMSKQQKLDAEAAAKFASALGMSGSGSNSGLNSSAVAAAAALQAAHQQMLRMPQNQQLPPHLLPFSPLLYPYQMMAQASGKPVTPASLAELQRQANENLQQLQRQYLLDMIPNSRNLPQNWKT